MLKRAIGLSLILVLLGAMGQVRAGEAGHTIPGAWKVAEVTMPNGVKNSQPQPSLWIFAQKHYSLAIVTGTKVRPNFPLNQGTDAEKIATFEAFTANSGTFSVSGNMLTTVPIVAKSEATMTNGFLLKYEMNFLDANTVTLTTRVGGAQAINTVWKLQRLE